MLGTSLEVPPLDGRVAARVPDGVQPGAVLRVQGKGRPRFRTAGRGDLFVRLRVRVPDHPSDEERKLYEQLRDLARRRG